MRLAVALIHFQIHAAWILRVLSTIISSSDLWDALVATIRQVASYHRINYQGRILCDDIPTAF